MSSVVTACRAALLLVLMCLLLAGQASADGMLGSKEILILHSYHPGFPWTDEVMKGMQEVLDDSTIPINFHVEYLDTKRQPDPEYFTHVLDAILHYKLENRFYDLVLVSNNDAFKFVVEHKQDIFPSVPVIFSGVEGIPEGLYDDGSIIAGVIEKPEYHDLIETILSLQPDTTEVVVIGNQRDEGGRLEAKMFQNAALSYAGKLSFTYLNDMPTDQLASEVRALQQGQVLFINGPLIDETGKLLSFSKKGKFLADNVSVAMYSPWDLCLGHGIVGGKLGSPRQQGKLAASLALQVFSEDPPENRTILSPEKSAGVFDYKILKKFKISEASLPKGYRLVNGPLQFTKLPSQTIWTVVGAFILSLAIILFLSNNILQRRKAKKLLRESEQQYKHLSQQFQVILDGIPEGLTLISREMKVIWSNKGAGTSYFNKRLGSVPGEYCCKMLYNRTEVCENCPAIQAFKTGCDEFATIITPDERTLDVKAFPLHDESGEVINVVMLASDVTEKNRLGEEAIRSSRLASLGELAAGVAHEINNPTALIMLNSELVQKSCSAAAPILQEHYRTSGDFPLGALNYSEMHLELPHLFQEMLDAATRIKNIVNDLKDFARKDTPEINDDIDLNEVVQAAIRLVGNTIKNSTHNFKVYYGENMPIVRGSFQRIEQVVINLLVNACQSLLSAEKSVQIFTYYDKHKKRNYLLLRDEGIGISAENMPFISDPFFTTKREDGGTGLGLSVVSSIVKDHGGTLDFQSPAGEGTTVCLSLPVLQKGES